MRLVGVFVAAALSLAGQHEQKEKKSKHPFIGDPKSIAAGKRLFVSGCAACHGAEGQGGRGPSLRERVMWHPLEDEALFTAIQKGIPAGGMPPANLPEDQAWQVVAFVRSLTSPAIENVPEGDAKAGQELFWGKSAGCAGCHRIRGQGGLLGPDLSNIGGTRSAAEIRTAILNPDEAIAQGYRAATVVLRDGKRIEGLARNRSNYSLQFQDSTGRLRLLSMADVAELRLAKSSLMPGDYRTRLTAEQLQNLLAFLSRQSVRGPADMKKSTEE